MIDHTDPEIEASPLTHEVTRDGITVKLRDFQITRYRRRLVS